MTAGTAGTGGAGGSADSVVPSSVTPSSDGLVSMTHAIDVAAKASPVPEKVAEPVIATEAVAAGSGTPSGTAALEPALPVSDIAVNPVTIPSSDDVTPVPADPATTTPGTEVPVAPLAPTIESAPAFSTVEPVATGVVPSERVDASGANASESAPTVVTEPRLLEAAAKIAVEKPVEAPVPPAPVIAVPAPSVPQVTQPAPAQGASTPVPAVAAPAQSGKKGKGKQSGGKNERAGAEPSFQPPPIMMYAPPAPSSPLGGPITWLGVTVLAVLLAGLVLNRDAFTPFGVDVAPLAVNTLTATTLTAQAGKVASTGMTVSDLVPGATVIRQTIQVVAEAGSKAMVPYVSALANVPADGTADAARVGAVRIVQLRCTDAQGAPMACDKATRFIEARVDPAGATSVVIETSGGLPTAATVRPGANGDLDILDGAGNIQKGGKFKGTPLVVLPPAGGTAKIPFLFLVGGGKTGLNHAAQDLGFSGATATVPTSKGAPGIADGGRAEILLYIYAGSDAPSTMAQARIPVTLALFAIGGE